jgi:cysteine desulfurase|nr:MAG TPA: cysteine sulfinate desulfinase/cysteine desulfurase [Caudoviricetes sp.]
MQLYLDSAATAKPNKEVLKAVMPYLTDDFYNPSSIYSDGVRVRRAIDNARESIAGFINADTDEIFFTSGSSESNCWAIQGYLLAGVMDISTTSIVTTKIEHKSIMECVDAMERFGNATYYCDVTYLDVDKDGFVNMEQLESVFKDREEPNYYDIFVSIQLANNECGTIQDIKAISDVIHKYGGVLHVDATQAFGQIPIDVKSMGIDMLSASAHKLEGGFKGVGLLYKKKDIEIQPIIYGSQNAGQRGGTENVAGIVGFAKAVELASEEMEDKLALSVKRDYFISELTRNGCKLNGASVHRLPNNINVMLPEGIGSEELLYMLDLDDIQCSAGSACNSHSKKPSYVLKALGLTDEQAARSVRFTISSDITYEAIDYVVEKVVKIMKIIRNSN